MIILNNGSLPVRVAGQWLQSGETLEVDMAVALRLIAANPDVVGPSTANENKPDEDAPGVDVLVIAEPSQARPTKRKK